MATTGTGAQLWVNMGAYYYSEELSELLRAYLQPLVKFRQFCDAHDIDKELHRGDIYHWNVYGDAKTQGGTLVETATVPETTFDVIQGTLTIVEFGHSVPFTKKLDNLSKVPVVNIINKVLKNDAKKTFDIAAFREFNRTPLRVVPAAGTSTSSLTLTTNGTATATNNVEMRKEHLKLISDLMKERNIPPYMQDDYMGIAWPSTWRPVKNDLETLHQYTQQGLGMIMNGEIGRYEGIRLIEQTNIPKGGAANSTTWNPSTYTQDPWDNAKSDWAFFFGEDTVAEAPVLPEEIRGAIPSDYGRKQGVAWYALDGFGIVHETPSQARILKWDSAA